MAHQPQPLVHGLPVHPPGGSRRGLGRQVFATLLVFAASGLWHGADWSFLAWGLLHGAYMIVFLLWRRSGRSLPKGAGVALTYAAVTFAWLLFRAESLPRAWYLIGRLFSPWDPGAGLRLLGMGLPELGWLLLALAQTPLLRRLAAEEEPPPGDMALVYLALSVILAFLVRAGENVPSAFIYFQF